MTHPVFRPPPPTKRRRQTRFSPSLWLKTTPPVLLAALPTPWAAESKRVHLIRFFHLSASLTEHKVRSQAPSPPCTPLPAPTTSPAKRLLQTRFSQSLWLKAAPPVLLAALPTLPAEESKQVHRRHFHLSASLTGHKVRSQAPSPPCTPLPSPTQRHQVASANSLLSSVFCFRLWWASLQAEV